jgi:hypothetical protein
MKSLPAAQGKRRIFRNFFACQFTLDLRKNLSGWATVCGGRDSLKLDPPYPLRYHVAIGLLGGLSFLCFWMTSNTS